MLKGIARLRGINGADYLMSATFGEGEKETLRRAGDFYGVEMVDVINYRWVRSGGRSAIKTYIFHKKAAGEMFARLSEGFENRAQYEEARGQFTAHVDKQFEALNEISRKYVAGANQCLFSNTKLRRKLDYNMEGGN